MIALTDEPTAGIYQDGMIRLQHPVNWPNGTHVTVTAVLTPDPAPSFAGRVIIVGFGLAGRCVADLLDGAKIAYTIIERNQVTVETQRALGRNIVGGDATDSATLISAGLHTASVLTLTIPDEEAVLRATALVRRLQPDIYIIARTNYSSKGMRASQLGADDVIKAEQAVAMQFYDRLHRHIAQSATGSNA